MRVSIISHREVDAFLYLNNLIYPVVCVTSEGDDVSFDVKNGARRLLHLAFDDIDTELGTYVVPMRVDVEDTLKFVQGEKTVVFTCPNGLTSSAALAYVSLCAEMPPENALRFLDRERHHPNRRIISHGADILGEPSIYTAYKEWLPEQMFHDLHGTRGVTARVS